MIRFIAALAAPIFGVAVVAALWVVPAGAQSVSGCGSVAIAKSDRDNASKLGTQAACFDQAAGTAVAAAGARRERIAAIAQPPPSTETPSAAIPTTGLAPVASGLDVASLLQPAWGTGELPGPDFDVGAFRFLCAPGRLIYDDPILYPGRAGASHLHQGFGNTIWDAFSTYASLRTTGDSTCNNALNRTAYWVPAMIHPSGKVVVPDGFAIYYKRMPASDPRCRIVAKACVDLPRGLRMVFGYNMQKPAKSDPARARWWNCPEGVPGHYATIREAAAKCPAGKQIELVLAAPDCWNGRDLDSADHRSHLAYSYYDGSHAYAVCPRSHPYLIPQITEEGFYTIDDQAAQYVLSSDMKLEGGVTLHGDWFGAWEDSIIARWTANCIDKLLSCSGGVLGEGSQLKVTHPVDSAKGMKLIDPPRRPD